MSRATRLKLLFLGVAGLLVVLLLVPLTSLTVRIDLPRAAAPPPDGAVSVAEDVILVVAGVIVAAILWGAWTFARRIGRGAGRKR